MSEFLSPLIRVREAAETILLEKPAATYSKIAVHTFPPGVLIRLGERSYRFHRQKLLEWLENGGSAANGNGCDSEDRTA